MAWTKTASQALLWLAVAATGCNGPIYSHRAALVLPEAMPARSAWKVAGSLSGPGHAVDGDVSTAALSNISYVDASLTIDFGRPAVFNMVVIDHGVRETGFARRTALLVSDDGQNFTLKAESPGTRRVSVISLVGPVIARYIRIQALDENDSPWSIAEIYLQ